MIAPGIFLSFIIFWTVEVSLSWTVVLNEGVPQEEALTVRQAASRRARAITKYLRLPRELMSDMGRFLSGSIVPAEYCLNDYIGHMFVATTRAYPSERIQVIACRPIIDGRWKRWRLEAEGTLLKRTAS
jgi:hypothetical protein